MESSRAMVVAELTQLLELARKLAEHLDPSHIELCRSLASEITFSIEKAICTAKTSSAGEAESVFFNGREQHVERLNEELSDKEHTISKKRRLLPNRTCQMRVSTVAGAELPPDDGHSWRKYGQKDIFGAKYPRSYYRCKHRNSQGCSAMKQVQKSDENLSLFYITYLGTHTCSNSLQKTTSKTHLLDPQQSLLDQQNSLVLHLDFQTNLKVMSESSELENQDLTSSFCFSSTPIDEMKPENALFYSSPRIKCGHVESLSSAFMSPTTSGSNCFPWPHCEMSSQADTDLAEIISWPNSVTDSSLMNVEFMLEYGQMDTDNPFDTSIFFVSDPATQLL